MPRSGVGGEVPVEPDADEARDLVLQELSKREYLEAQPTWFDRLASGFLEWLGSLEFDAGAGTQQFGLLLVALLVVGLLVAAFFIFGRPALARRSRVSGELFGEHDDRDSAAIRRAAQRSAADERWADATTDMFRAIARGLAERTVVSTLPGTTAQHFSAKAARAFPSSAGELAAAADDFDEVRYLQHEGTRAQYERVAALEEALRTQTPRLEHADADADAAASTAGVS